ncbi:MAG: hypothetical protein IKN66_01900 [Ruminococcus sp.]|nr:hypothetical protein [Ruminococcus sp.]
MKDSTSYKVIADHMPDRLRKLLLGSADYLADDLMEVRLHGGGAVCFVFPNRVSFLGKNGSIVASFSYDAYILDQEDIRECIDKLCHYSVHSCTKQLSEGFFVIGNGVRVGVSGIYSSSESPVLTEFCSLNFRISRQVINCADRLFSETFDRNVIICGGANSGKTTLLRELCRLNGNLRKTVLIDERNEIAAFCSGYPRNDVGAMTDIIGNCSRSKGIMSAIRTLSPELIVCDEIASSSDAEAIISGLACGVRFLVTAHGENEKEVSKRPELKTLTDSGFFHKLVFLRGASSPGEVGRIVRL